MFYQHGDVLLFLTEEIPITAQKIKTNVIQEGESTGHAHRLYDDEADILQEPTTKEKYLRLVKPTALRHEEHKEIMLPPGNYRVGIVKEYDHFNEEARNVAD